ncbi:hypothetical protein ACFU5O_29410 [Streptomyces sp. NPDC057445]|uniref:hypothetical protein n=1 Tax=Streptomyces sp. NPDC057445 TaxID=3346136 RepID=UPI0036C730BA
MPQIPRRVLPVVQAERDTVVNSALAPTARLADVILPAPPQFAPAAAPGAPRWRSCASAGPGGATAR